MRIFPRRKVELSFREFCVGLKYLFKSKSIREGLVSRFENEFAKYIGVKFAVSLPSERIGFSLFLDTLSFDINDEVIMSSYNYHVIAATIKNKGLKPVFVDIDEKTWNIDPQKIEQKITTRTRVLIATHLYGQSCPIKEIKAICIKHNIMLIEDAAHACGGKYRGEKIGGFGDVAFFSFGTGKTLVALGGAMLTTNNEQIFKKIKDRLIEMSLNKKPSKIKNILMPIAETILTNRALFTVLVYPALIIFNKLNLKVADRVVEDNYTLDEGAVKEGASSFFWFQAALGLGQLGRLEHLNDRRIYYAGLINKQLEDINQVQIPYIPGDQEHTGIYYGIVAENADQLRNYLLARGVDTKMGAMRACNTFDFPESTGSCPIAERISPKLIELPCYPSLSLKDAYYQVNLIRKFYGKEPKENHLASNIQKIQINSA